ncbi:hypothetical protein HZA73_09560 [candidate division TA06 bacterium]|nr:hypothetical protein [candidate division TA06 bacterium]
MTWVELTKGKYKGYMVDGYTPGEPSLINTAYKMIKHGGLSTKEARNLENNLEYAHSDGMTENSIFMLFQKFKLSCLNDNCALTQDCHANSPGKLKCINLYYTSGKNFSSLESNVHRKVKELPHSSVITLKIEYAHDRQLHPGQHYIQNIILFNSEIHKTVDPKYCIHNWINTLNFAIKEDKTYLDYKSFYDAWSIFLGYHMDRIIGYNHRRMD